MKDENSNKTDIKSSDNKKKRKLTLEDIKDLPLIDNDFFLFAADDNKELADVLIKPALNHLKIKNYNIISVKSEVSYSNFKNHSIRIDCEIKLDSGEHILIEIQNGNPERMPVKRIRFEQSLLDTKEVEKGESYNTLPDIISLIYTTDPLPNHDTGHTLNDLAVVDLTTGEIAFDYGKRVLIVNGKYKTKGSEQFSEIIEDLQKSHAEDITNQVIKDIHLKTKNTVKGQNMLSDYIEERYGDIIQKYEKELQKIKEENQEKDKEIQRYKNLMKEKGITID